MSNYNNLLTIGKKKFVTSNATETSKLYNNKFVEIDTSWHEGILPTAGNCCCARNLLMFAAIADDAIRCWWRIII
jgi:hypothetical protein